MKVWSKLMFLVSSIVLAGCPTTLPPNGYLIETNVMAPTIEAGDIVIVDPEVERLEIEVGDIFLFIKADPTRMDENRAFETIVMPLVLVDITSIYIVDTEYVTYSFRDNNQSNVMHVTFGDWVGKVIEVRESDNAK